MSFKLLRFLGQKAPFTQRANDVLLLAIALNLSSCLPGPGFYQKSQVDLASGGGAAIEAIMDGDKAVATVSALSSVVQTISAPSSSSMAGVSLAISPGTLQVDMAIGLEESVGLISSAAADEMGMSFDGEAGVAINLTNDAGVSDIPASAPPMQLNIPIFSSPLRLAGEDSSLVVFFRRAASSDSCSERIFPPSTFEKQGNAIAIGVRRFGAYQPLWVPTKELEMKEQEATDADGSFVIERQGCKVVTKAEERKMPKVSISDLRIERNGMVFKFSAKIEGDTPKVCKLYARSLIDDRKYSEESDRPEFKVDLSGAKEAIDGRAAISCELKSGRTVETPFKAFRNYDFLIKMEASYNEHLRFSSNVNLGSIEKCWLEGHDVFKDGHSDPFEHPVDTPDKFEVYEVIVGSEKDFHSVAAGRMVCEKKGGGKMVSNEFRFYVKYTDTRETPPYSVWPVMGAFSGAASENIVIRFDKTDFDMKSTDSYMAGMKVCPVNNGGYCTDLQGTACNALVNRGSFSLASPNPVTVDPGFVEISCSLSEALSEGGYFVQSFSFKDNRNVIHSYDADQNLEFYMSGMSGNEKIAYVAYFDVRPISEVFLEKVEGENSSNGGGSLTTFTFNFTGTAAVQPNVREICWGALGTSIGNVGPICANSEGSNSLLDANSSYQFEESFDYEMGSGIDYVHVRFLDRSDLRYEIPATGGTMLFPVFGCWSCYQPYIMLPYSSP